MPPGPRQGGASCASACRSDTSGIAISASASIPICASRKPSVRSSRDFGSSAARQLGSARSVHLAMSADQVHFPRPSDGQKLVTFDWAPIRYRNVISVLKNPFYAGAYAYGKSEKRIEIVEGRARKSYGHGRPLEEWE